MLWIQNNGLYGRRYDSGYENLKYFFENQGDTGIMNKVGMTNNIIFEERNFQT